MGFPNNKTSNKKFVFNKGSYKSQCAYMLMLIKVKDPKAWMSFKQEFVSVSDEDSHDFFEKLVAFYKGEKVKTSNIVELRPTKPIVKQKDLVEKTAKKKVAKKISKKVAKKTAKKVTKKVAKKSASKNIVKKKTAKKKVAKKVTKKNSSTKKAA